MNRWLLAMSLCVATAACFDPHVADGAIACGDAGCPSGQVCDRHNVCRDDHDDHGENVVLATARADLPGQLLAYCDGEVRPVRDLDDVRSGRAVAWGDPDGDGRPALAFANLDDRIHVLTMEGDLVFESSKALLRQTRATVWADVDGDGDVELIASDHLASLQVLRYDAGDLVTLWRVTDLVHPYGLDWGDLDGDGDLDLAVTADEPHLAVYRNDGGALVRAWTSAVDDGARGARWLDADGDADLDLVVASRRAPLRLYRNDGGALVEAWHADEISDAEAIDLGDLDGDGDLDVAICGHEQPSRVYRNDGGVMTAAWASAPGLDTWSVQWFDVDGDGDLDLTLGNRASPSQIVRNDGGDLVDWLELPSGVRSLAWARWPAPAGRASACDATYW